MIPIVVMEPGNIYGSELGIPDNETNLGKSEKKWISYRALV